MSNRTILTIIALLAAFLSGCVTQKFENDETPITQKQANRDDMAATRVSLGLGYLKMGNMPQAKQNLEKAKNFSPNMVQVYTAFAHYYETVGEYELTVDSYETALSIESDDADTLNNYGVYLCRQGEVAAAETQFLKAINVPTYLLVGKSYENLATCFLQIDNFDKAEMYLNKAIMHNTGSASTLYQLIRLHYAKGDYKLAKLYIQRFEKASRRFTPQFLALAYKTIKKLEQRRIAKNYGTMLVKMYPQSWEAQQYVLNELELIEADNLATKYHLLHLDEMQYKPVKRTVKLSPKPDARLADAIQVTEYETIKKEKNQTLSQTSAPLLVTKQSTEIDVNTPQSNTAVEKQAVQNTEKSANTGQKQSKTDAEPKPEPEEKKQFKFHVVAAGETLYSISLKYNITMKALRRWNKLSKRIYIKDIIFLEDPTLVKQ